MDISDHAKADNIHTLPVPNVETMRQHLEHLFGGYLDGCHEGLIELAWTDPNPGSDGRYRLSRAQLFGTDQLDELVARAAELNVQQYCNVYIGAALRKPDTFPGARANAGDILALTCGYVDLDDEGAVAKAKGIYGAVKPSLAVVTGRSPFTRAQCWWRLEEPITDPAESEALLKGMAAALGGDPSVTDPARVMRLAGSIAWPVKPGRQVEQTYIAPLREPGQPSYMVEQLARLFPPCRPTVQVVHNFAHVTEVVEPDGITREQTPLGFAGKVNDGRDLYLLRTIEAVLIQLIGESGLCPLQADLVDAVWPQYSRNADLTKRGKGFDEVVRKCGYSIRRFQEGKINGLRDVREAKAIYARKKAKGGYGRQAPNVTIVPPTKQEQNETLKLRSAFPIVEDQIPVRDWVVPGLLLRRNLSVLVAPPASGKSLLSLQMAIAVALGMSWGGWFPRQAEKVLVINAEDDLDEMQRRLFAAARLMGVDQVALVGRVLLADALESVVIATMDSRTKSVIRTPLVEQLIVTIEAEGIGLVVADPFAETFEGDENSNSEVKWAGILWREVARRTRTALWLVHHTKKYAGDMAGVADASRGGGALIGTARIMSTLFQMTEDEAKLFNTPVEERDQYVRFDDAKSNHSAKGCVKWFRKVTVTLNNGAGLIPGDDVGVLEPWNPPGVMDGVSCRELGLALESIERGVLADDGRPTGQLFGPTTRSKDHWAGRVLMSLLDISEDRAKGMIKAWLESGVLYTVEYDDAVQRKPRTGVKFDRSKHPDEIPQIYE